MSTVKNNKMIAEFMGCGKDEVENIHWIDTEYRYGFTSEELQYHKSWDWLMPVVEKINNILDDDDEFVYSVNIHPNMVTIYYENHDRIFISNEHGSTMREMIYQAVVEFIKQYN